MSPEAFAIWFTGLSGAGKTTLCRAAALQFQALGLRVQILDGDEIRASLCSDLGFSTQDRYENIRRVALVAELLVHNGIIVLIAAIAPLREMREIPRRTISALIEVFVDAPLEICELRDPKGLYKKARSGQLPGFTGIESIYEPPLTPHITCHTHKESIAESTDKIVAAAFAFRSSVSATHVSFDGSDSSLCRTIAVDFDGVIANYDGWRGRNAFGEPRGDVLTALRTLKAEGWKIIVHTTRRREDIAQYLHNAFIPFDQINSNGNIHSIGCKPRATIYWDDRAVCYSGDAIRDLYTIRNFRTWNGRP